MPTIKQQVIANQNRIAAGGETGTGVGPQQVAPSPAPTPPQDLPAGGGLPQRGMFPADLTLNSDRSDSNRAFRGAGVRSSTFPYAASGTITSTIVEKAQASSSSGGGGSSSSNLTAGPGISITSSGKSFTVSGTVGSLQVPNIFSVSGSLPVTAFPNGGPISISLVDEPVSTFFAAPPTGTVLSYATPYLYPITGTNGTGSTLVVSLNYTTTWLALTGETVGNIIVDSNSNLQRCVVSGTTKSGTHPTWQTAVGAITQDGSVQWMCMGTNAALSGDTFFLLTYSSDGTTVSGVTDSASNTYASVFTQSYSDGINTHVVTLWSVVIASAIANNTSLTITVAGSSTSSKNFFYFNNLGPKTGSVSNGGTAATWSSGSLAISSHEILLSVSGSTLTNALGVGSLFSTINGIGSGAGNAGEAWYNPAAAGTYSDSWKQASSLSTAFVATMLSYSYAPTFATEGIPYFREIFNVDLDNAVFGASGPNHNAGAVPDPGATAGSTRFLNEDATWLTAVTSIGISVTVPSIFSVAVSNSPVTTSGTIGITLSLQNETANKVWAGPTSGSPAAPTFRSLVSADMPFQFGGTNVQTASYLAVAGDSGKLIAFNTNATSSYSFVNKAGGTTSATFGAAPSAGNLIVVAIGSSSASAVTLSGVSATWHAIQSPVNPGDGYYTSLFWGLANGTQTTITVTGQGGSFPGVTAYNYSGSPASPTVTSSSGTGTGTAVGTAVSVTAANSLVVMWSRIELNNAIGTTSAPYTVDPPSGSSTTWFVYGDSSATGSITPPLTLNGSQTWGATSAAFTPQAGMALTLTLPASPPSSTWAIFVQNYGAGTLTINPNGLQLDGSSGNITGITQGQGMYITTDGTNYFSMRGGA